MRLGNCWAYSTLVLTVGWTLSLYRHQGPRPLRVQGMIVARVTGRTCARNGHWKIGLPQCTKEPNNPHPSPHPRHPRLRARARGSTAPQPEHSASHRGFLQKHTVEFKVTVMGMGVVVIFGVQLWLHCRHVLFSLSTQ